MSHSVMVRECLVCYVHARSVLHASLATRTCTTSMGWHGNSWGRGAWHARDGEWPQAPWSSWHGDRDAGKGGGKHKGDGRGYGRDRDSMSLAAALKVVRPSLGERAMLDRLANVVQGELEVHRGGLHPFDGPPGCDPFLEGHGAASGAPWHMGQAPWHERRPPWRERQAPWLALGSAAVSAIGGALTAMMPRRTDRKDEAEPQTLTQRVGALLSERPRAPRAPRGQESPRIEDLSEVDSLRAEVARMREQLAQTRGRGAGGEGEPP